MTALLAEPAMPSEFDLIQRFFTRPACASGALLGVGDDAALLSLSAPASCWRFPATCWWPAGIFCRMPILICLATSRLAVNLSDLAAMGATPRWATLALALPEVNEAWLAAFSRGFF
jgi:thiamine-monophosphate kinase